MYTGNKSVYISETLHPESVLGDEMFYVLTNCCDVIAKGIACASPEGRRKISVARTHLETAILWLDHARGRD